MEGSAVLEAHPYHEVVECEEDYAAQKKHENCGRDVLLVLDLDLLLPDKTEEGNGREEGYQQRKDESNLSSQLVLSFSLGALL